ncbi:hypothetical protein [Bradyrhizobium sp. 191]|uniref:hypothetical protein n=1 Tax=Bradyrhizobium sp. 191 TaxID=2782659 RepID=UPI001FFEB4E0|nr:hypothetical protein [Bradyrhizobium sp. 191]UPJ68196.1 hypothetical protein IVB23_12950 [Bradyrhizobium sp. 191]
MGIENLIELVRMYEDISTWLKRWQPGIPQSACGLRWIRTSSKAERFVGDARWILLMWMVAARPGSPRTAACNPEQQLVDAMSETKEHKRTSAGATRHQR